MQKNKNGGFVFFDLLTSLVIVMMFIIFVSTAASLVVYYYTVHKEYIIAKNIMFDVLYKIDIGEQLPSKFVKTVFEKDFIVAVNEENVPHDLIGTINQMPILVITTIWISVLGNYEKISLTVLNKKKIGLVGEEGA